MGHTVAKGGVDVSDDFEHFHPWTYNAMTGTFEYELKQKEGNIPAGTYKIELFIKANYSQGGAPSWAAWQAITNTPSVTVTAGGGGGGGPGQGNE